MSIYYVDAAKHLLLSRLILTLVYVTVISPCGWLGSSSSKLRTMLIRAYNLRRKSPSRHSFNTFEHHLVSNVVIKSYYRRVSCCQIICWNPGGRYRKLQCRPHIMNLFLVLFFKIAFKAHFCRFWYDIQVETANMAAFLLGLLLRLLGYYQLSSSCSFWLHLVSGF